MNFLEEIVDLVISDKVGRRRWGIRKINALPNAEREQVLRDLQDLGIDTSKFNARRRKKQAPDQMPVEATIEGKKQAPDQMPVEATIEGPEQLMYRAITTFADLVSSRVSIALLDRLDALESCLGKIRDAVESLTYDKRRDQATCQPHQRKNTIPKIAIVGLKSDQFRLLTKAIGNAADLRLIDREAARTEFPAHTDFAIMFTKFISHRHVEAAKEAQKRGIVGSIIYHNGMVNTAPLTISAAISSWKLRTGAASDPS